MKIYSNGKMLQVPPRGPAGPDGNPLGTIIGFMGTAVPKDYLVCDGKAYDIADYPELSAFFEAQFGTKNYFGGDGTTTFAVPDLRNLFLRGYHGDSEEQLSGDIGERQEATLIPNVYAGSESISIRTPKDSNASILNSDFSLSTSGGSRYSIGQRWVTDSFNTPYQHAVRPINMAVLYCIKAAESVAGGQAQDICSLTAGSGIVIVDNEISVQHPNIPLTRAEYNALSEEEKNNDSIYIIIDEDAPAKDYQAGSGISIENNTISAKSTIVSLTSAEYDALNEEEKNRDDIYYCIEDAQELGFIITQ